jgi:hypothetical protein
MKLVSYQQSKKCQPGLKQVTPVFFNKTFFSKMTTIYDDIKCKKISGSVFIRKI